jgi:hypothetical protein
MKAQSCATMNTSAYPAAVLTKLLCYYEHKHGLPVITVNTTVFSVYTQLNESLLLDGLATFGQIGGNAGM